jgi:hypothetical protein
MGNANLWEERKEWLRWTIRDELYYGFIKPLWGKAVIGIVVSICLALLGYVKAHLSLEYFGLGAATVSLLILGSHWLQTGGHFPLSEATLEPKDIVNQIPIADSLPSPTGVASAGEPVVDILQLTQSIHICRIDVNFGRLAENSILELLISAFNGALQPISVDRRVTGVIRAWWGTLGKEKDKDLHLTLLPQIDLQASYIENVPRCTPFKIRLLQPLSGATANEMWAAFWNGRMFQFEFIELHIAIGNNGQSERFPLWDGVSCSRVSNGEVFHNQVFIRSAVMVANPASDK